MMERSKAYGGPVLCCKDAHDGLEKSTFLCKAYVDIKLDHEENRC